MTSGYLVAWETASARGSQRFSGPRAHELAGDYARQAAGWLVQYPSAYLHIEAEGQIDLHTHAPRICSAYSWTSGRGWHRIRGVEILRLERPAHQAAALHLCRERPEAPQVASRSGPPDRLCQRVRAGALTIARVGRTMGGRAGQSHDARDLP
jgi:hypothetical protein